MITINVKSVLYGIQAVLPHFQRAQARSHHHGVVDARRRFPIAPHPQRVQRREGRGEPR